MSVLTTDDFKHLHIPSLVEQYTSTRLHAGRTQYTGACPYDDCLGDENGFIVWAELSKQGRHFYCRTCSRSGDIVKLIQDVKDVSFFEAKMLLEIGQGKPAIIRRQSAQSEWKKKELAFLTDCYPYLRRGLQHERACAYLAQRGHTLEIAQAYGLCYIPPYKEMNEATQDAWHSMKQWTDRLIFPLSDGGFTGRALFLWTPGMNEDEHKALLDDFNRRVKIYNQRATVKKVGIPRWYTTSTTGYFHGQVLTQCEHITIVEGPFDALALLATDIHDALAAGRNGIRSEDLPVQVLSATIAFDGDEKGQEAALKHEKVFRRKGIQTRRCTPLARDGKGKDWSERYRLYSVEGLAQLFTREQSSEEPFLCSACGMDAVTALEEVIFSFDEDGTSYCPECWEKRQSPAASESMTYEQFLSTAHRIAESLPGCEIHIDPPEYTIQDRAREVEQELAQREQSVRQQLRRKTGKAGAA